MKNKKKNKQPKERGQQIGRRRMEDDWRRSSGEGWQAATVRGVAGGGATAAGTERLQNRHKEEGASDTGQSQSSAGYWRGRRGSRARRSDGQGRSRGSAREIGAATSVRAVVRAAGRRECASELRGSLGGAAKRPIRSSRLRFRVLWGGVGRIGVAGPPGLRSRSLDRRRRGIDADRCSAGGRRRVVGSKRKAESGLADGGQSGAGECEGDDEQ
ncbi:hypothetical protein EUGRSUZ_C04055 [Eucalyptus grandis]|uniref:Uncharacterized protein n=2 Tax=Eucalyptus grandis TaxID=71139 RepID=A0ACC3LLB9_EUCGR|nr:hypothetical protein EUGRSUZ_C04055 [Eucalyptus grandis]